MPKDEINMLDPAAARQGRHRHRRAPDLEDYSLILRRCRECQCRSPGVGCVIRTCALWNAHAHSGADRLGTLVVSYYVGALWLTPWIVLDPPFEVWWLLLTGGLLHASYITALAAAYDRGALAVAYPVARGSAPLVVAALGIWLLDQVPTPFTVIGAVLVAIGLLMIGNVGWNTGQRQALALALTTGVVIGGYTLVDARAVEDVNGWAFFAMSSYLGATFAIIGNRLPIERLQASLRSGVPVGLASSTSYALILLAYTPTRRTWRRSARPRSSSGLRWCRGP